MRKDTEILKGKRLLVIAGADVHCKIVQAAKEFGVYTIVTDYLQPHDSPAKQIADEYWMLNITEVDAIVEKCRKEHVDGVLAFCIDPAQLPYQKICERLGVPCYGTAEQFRIMTNKRLFKDFARKHGVDVIPEYKLSNVKEGLVVYPVLVKPSDSRGSRGQTVCYSKEEVLAAIEVAVREASDGEVLIERYMVGARDMSFSYVVIGGHPYLLKIGDRYLGDVEDNLDRQHMATVLPSQNAEIYRRDVEPRVIAMIKALGINFGALFMQGFWEKGKVYMYDPGLRFPGGDFDIVLKQATGYDNMKTFVRYALTGDVNSQCGNPVDAYKLGGGACLILSIAARAGKIVKIEGLEDISSNPCVRSVSQRYHEGEIVPNSGDIRQRVLEFVVHLPSRAHVFEFVSDVYKKLKIRDESGADMIVSKVTI